MNFESLKKRAVRILTTPPETFYAISRHWAILGTCVAVGTMITAAKVATDPAVYQGKATLVINTKDVVAGSELRDSAEEIARRLNQLKTILYTSSTIRSLVKDLKIERVLQQAENPEEEGYSGLRLRINNVRKKMLSAMTLLEDPVENDWGEERMLQQAISSFKSRSNVEVDGTDNTIRLFLWGVNRDMLRRELEVWIDSFKAHVRQMHQEGQTEYLQNRIDHYNELDEAARTALKEYRTEHPEASETVIQHIHEQVVEWRLVRSDLERRIDFFDSDLDSVRPTTTNTASEDPQAQTWRNRIRELDVQIAEKIAERGPNSRSVQSLRDKKEVFEAKLAGLGVAVTATTSPEQAKHRLQSQKDKTTERLAGLLVKERQLREKMQELKELETEHEAAQRRVREYQEMSQEDGDRLEAAQELLIKIGDRPEVSTTPVNSYPRKQVLFGSLGGLALGLIAALALEILCGKVRFRNDITAEFGLPVVGVIPKR